VFGIGDLIGREDVYDKRFLSGAAKRGFVIICGLGVNFVVSVRGDGV